MQQNRMSKHTQEVLRWREALTILPNNYFFDLFRMYLGEIQTPFNKQKLIEQLSAFLRKEETRNAIFKLLSKNDMLIITAVLELPVATQDRLGKFLSSEFTYADLYERLLNLEERLILYRTRDAYSGKSIYRINPLLDEEFEKRKDISLLLPEAEESENISRAKKISTEFLGAFFSFVCMNPFLCKNDGTLKKKSAQLIEEFFPLNNDPQFFSDLIKSCENLGLFRNCDGELRIVQSRWENFATLSETERVVWLVAASSPVTRSEMFRRAQLVWNLVFSMPQNGYEKSVLLRKAFLLNEKMSATPSEQIFTGASGRFATLLEKNEQPKNAKTENNFISALIDSARQFGLLKKTRSLKDGKSILVGTISDADKQINSQKTVSINAGFSVSVMPGADFEKLLPIIRASNLLRCDTISTYEITRQSCMRAFDSGVVPEKFFASLEEVLMHQIPKVLRDSIEEWYAIYQSASLYRGYVLQVSSEKSAIIENNREIAKHIKKILAQGIFLLDFETEEEASEVIAKSGLDFIGQVKTMRSSTETLPFQPICQTETIASMQKQNGVSLASGEEMSQYFSDMRAHLEKLNLPRDQAEGLLSRIERKIILSKEQLCGASVRAEQIEASGMDYQGKVHIIEYAISNGNMVELIYDDEQSETGKRLILGSPIFIERHPGDSIVKIRVEPSHEIQQLSIGRARTVKRIRGSIFRD